MDAKELKAMSRAFDVARESNDERAWESAGVAILALCRACATADDVESVLRAQRGVFEVEGSLYPCPEVVDALFERIASMSDEDAGRSLGWLSRSVAPPDLIGRPGSYSRLSDPLKRAARDAVEAHLETLRGWSRAVGISRSVGASYLMGLCTNADVADARSLVVAASDGEVSPAASATAILAAGMIAARTNDQELRSECDALATQHVLNKNALVRLCAAVALSLRQESVGEAAIRALAEHVSKPVKLPPEWGWVLAAPPQPKSDTLAIWILAWVRTPMPAAAVDALLAKPLAKLSRESAGCVRDALVHLGVEAKSGPVGPYELVANELDELGLRALRAVADGRFATHGIDGWKLLPTYGIAGMLAEQDTEWRPVDIDVEGARRHWSYNRIFAAAIFGEIEIDHAVSTLVKAIAPETLATLITQATAIQSAIGDATRNTPQLAEREQKFAAAALGALAASGYDVNEAFDAALSLRGTLATHVAPAILAMYSAALPDKYVTVVARALSATRCEEPLHSLFKGLPEAQQVAILHHEDAQPWAYAAWPIWEQRFDVVTLTKFLKFLAFNLADQERGVATLAKGGGSIARLLEEVRFNDQVTRSRAEPILAEAIRAARAS